MLRNEEGMSAISRLYPCSAKVTLISFEILLAYTTYVTSHIRYIAIHYIRLVYCIYSVSFTPALRQSRKITIEEFQPIVDLNFGELSFYHKNYICY